MIDDPHYALVPRYRHTGDGYVALHWHENNDGDHVILAKGRPQLEGVWRGVLKKNPWAKPKEMYAGRVVLPPKWLADAYRKGRYEREVGTFNHIVCCRAQDYRDLHGEWPAEISPCLTYSPSDAEELEDSYSVSHHYGCVNCSGGMMLLVEGTWEERFEDSQRRGLNLTRAPKEKAPVPIEVGLAADEGAPVFCFMPGIMSGMTVAELFPGAEDVKCLFWNTTPLFFLQGIKFPVLIGIAEIKAESDRFMKREEERRNEKLKKLREQREEESRRELGALFPKPRRNR